MVSLALAAMIPAASLAQVPDQFKNLKVLPQAIKKDDLVQMMRGYSGALGVRCTHCHVGEEGKPLSTFDFAADAKEPKEVARAMMRMTKDLNEKYLSRIKTPGEEKVPISCSTCHHGLTRPEDLQGVLLDMVDKKGLDATLEKYRELRKRYYGGYEYDFSPRPLNMLAEHLARTGKLETAIRVQEVNAELHPEDGNVHLALGNLYAESGDRSRAIASMGKAIEVDPGNVWARKRLEELEEEKTP